jgi:acyl-CoA synthetase (AMP-forming)/AMP-acid ligase II
VTHLQCTPSLAGVLADDEDAAAALAGLSRLLVGGEALPAPLATTLAGLPPSVHNMYGPTEATVWATTQQVDDSGTVLIGRPMAGVLAYVVDAALRPVPVNVPGELLLGGSCVAHGYLRRPALTAERFVPDPFSALPGARLYRTGDLVRWRAGGELEFLGRLDHQVKIDGHRIELGEIENVLRAHAEIRAAVAAVRGDDTRRRIVAYCVAAQDGGVPVSVAGVKAFAARTLPDYMIPSDVVFLDELPLTPNGKVDRARLPDPEDRPVAEYRAPDNDIERQVADVFADVLRQARIGVDDNFFELGGSSLLAVAARARLRPVLGERLSLVDIFRFPTVRGLTTALGGGDMTGQQLAEVRNAATRRAGALARRARARSATGETG